MDELVLGLRTLGLPDHDVQLHVARIKESADAACASGSIAGHLPPGGGVSLRPGSDFVCECQVSFILIYESYLPTSTVALVPERMPCNSFPVQSRVRLATFSNISLVRSFTTPYLTFPPFLLSLSTLGCWQKASLSLFVRSYVILVELQSVYRQSLLAIEVCHISVSAKRPNILSICISTLACLCTHKLQTPHPFDVIVDIGGNLSLTSL